MYTVKTRSNNNKRTPWRTYSEYDTLAEALSVANRLQCNTSLQTIVDLPANQNDVQLISCTQQQ